MPRTPDVNLLELGSHFSFGENWRRYAQKIDETRIEEAEKSLLRLVGFDAIQGRTFLDIGSGSGLFSLAALRLGCTRLLAVDLDPACVDTTRALLERHAPESQWDCRCQSVFDLTPDVTGAFDVVYAWGVLHHTGAMRKAMRRAAAQIAPGGMLAIALYGKTPFCWFWRVEKKIYSQAPAWAQAVMKAVYLSLFRFRLAFKGETLRQHRDNYHRQRGMDMHHDCHDWLGGYPYESIAPNEVMRLLHDLGLECVRSFVYPSIGLFGNGCDEYCFTRPAST